MVVIGTWHLHLVGENDGLAALQKGPCNLNLDDARPPLRPWNALYWAIPQAHL